MNCCVPAMHVCNPSLYSTSAQLSKPNLMYNPLVECLQWILVSCDASPLIRWDWFILPMKCFHTSFKHTFSQPLIPKHMSAKHIAPRLGLNM